MNARAFLVALAIFTAAAALGGGFALLGPVRLIRIFGTVAFLAGAAGCVLQIYALHEFAPRTYAALRDWVTALRQRGAMAGGGAPAVVPAILSR